MTVDVWMLVAAAAPGVLAAGGLWVRVNRLEKDVEKLDASKASKEFADGLKAKIAELKDDLDKRFDHLEDLIRSNGR